MSEYRQLPYRLNGRAKTWVPAIITVLGFIAGVIWGWADVKSDAERALERTVENREWLYDMRRDLYKFNPNITGGGE